MDPRTELPIVSRLALDLRVVSTSCREYLCTFFKGKGGRGPAGASEIALTALSERPIPGLSNWYVLSKLPFLIKMLLRAGIDSSTVVGASSGLHKAGGRGHCIDAGLPQGRPRCNFSGVSRGVILVGSSATVGLVLSDWSVNSVIADNGDSGSEFCAIALSILFCRRVFGTLWRFPYKFCRRLFRLLGAGTDSSISGCSSIELICCGLRDSCDGTSAHASVTIP